MRGQGCGMCRVPGISRRPALCFPPSLDKVICVSLGSPCGKQSLEISGIQASHVDEETRLPNPRP